MGISWKSIVSLVEARHLQLECANFQSIEESGVSHGNKWECSECLCSIVMCVVCDGDEVGRIVYTIRGGKIYAEL